MISRQFGAAATVGSQRVAVIPPGYLLVVLPTAAVGINR